MRDDVVEFPRDAGVSGGLSAAPFQVLQPAVRVGVLLLLWRHLAGPRDVPATGRLLGRFSMWRIQLSAPAGSFTWSKAPVAESVVVDPLGGEGHVLLDETGRSTARARDGLAAALEAQSHR